MNPSWKFLRYLTTLRSSIDNVAISKRYMAKRFKQLSDSRCKDMSSSLVIFWPPPPLQYYCGITRNCYSVDILTVMLNLNNIQEIDSINKTIYCIKDANCERIKSLKHMGDNKTLLWKTIFDCYKDYGTIIYISEIDCERNQWWSLYVAYKKWIQRKKTAEERIYSILAINTLYQREPIDFWFWHRQIFFSPLECYCL